MMERKFTSPPDPAAFKALVWEIARQIPPGNVFTYGQIASLIPPPQGMNLRDYDAFGARWVGGAMAGCPADVPWQRVINSQGKISLRKGGGYEEQRRLLEEEGVLFDDRERIDLNKFRWQGPPAAWLKAHGLNLPPEKPSQMEMKL
jgi:methylated-DNA-protein-cysteine methyltransferase related protein